MTCRKKRRYCGHSKGLRLLRRPYLSAKRPNSASSYLELWGRLPRACGNRGRDVQTVTDSSFDAWTKFYRQDENSQNAIISYYTKGAMVALCLDLLRTRTNGAVSLDDVMDVLWSRYGKTGVGLENETLRPLRPRYLALISMDFSAVVVFHTATTRGRMYGTGGP